MMNKRELRFKTADFRAKTTTSGDMIVSGYVNLTDQFSDPLSIGVGESFVEKIAPGAFARSLERAEINGDEIEFLAEHDPEKILSSTRNGSLTLKEDNEGLYMSAVITPTSWGRDFYNLISDGIIRNFSFGFTIENGNDTWEFNDNNVHRRIINDLNLFEVSVVRHPAYPQSYIESRDLISSEKLLEIRKGDKMDKDIEKREEEVKEETEKEESELVDVTGSIISIDQRLEKIDKKLSEVLDIFLEQDEEVEEEIEEEVKEEKQEEEDIKKKEIEKADNNQPKEEDRGKEKTEDMLEEINKLIEEFDKKEK